MVKMTNDQDIGSKLRDLKERVQLCDEAGKVLGYFQPVVDKVDYEGVDALVSQAELERRSREGGGRQLAEILADLQERV